MWRRPSGRLHCEEWRWRFLEFPYAGPYGKKRRTRKAPPKRRGEQKAGAQFTTMELQDGNRPHGRRVRSGRRAQDRHGLASGVQDMLAWSEIATGGAYPGMWKPAVVRTPRSWRWPIRRRPRRHWLRICGDFAGFVRKMKHRTFLNLSALKFPTILVSDGRRGFSIVIGSRNCWRRSGSDHRYRKHQPASE